MASTESVLRGELAMASNPFTSARRQPIPPSARADRASPGAGESPQRKDLTQGVDRCTRTDERRCAPLRNSPEIRV